MGPLLDPERTTVEARTIDRPVALLSIDLETDYGSGLDEALSRTNLCSTSWPGSACR